MYKLLPLLDYRDAIRMCRVFMATYFATYVIQECPALNKKPEEFYNGPVNQETWHPVVMVCKIHPPNWTIQNIYMINLEIKLCLIKPNFHQLISFDDFQNE